MPSFERSQNCVCHYRSAAENVVSQSVGKRVQNRHAAGTDRRLADTARADRSFRIGNVNRIPLHVRRNVHDRRRPVVVESLGQRHPVVLVINPLLTQRVADAKYRAAQNLATESVGVKHGSHVGNCHVVFDDYLPVSRSTSTSAKPSHKGVGQAVARREWRVRLPAILPGQRSGRSGAVILLMPLGSSWPS